ncbi:polyadenylate-binding protein 1 [Sphaeroforma arctica JP610]|uniref:Polyadenylate-binding protein n=1 Tax=Sphaeroforma arctica JP610 TaxID=667725 RepID=A0A0L0FSB7_9EUKA|nr:polyadenylate-binding protein 1 [Sphaeroforma arctica JP610]KNC79589.1 polyadenylate-binding protein 1 [Sphaeroforma arctica JP610]|eukprot:XP_014153491.1 polyadenylate-binding protein 1 [Sphaeroforma arctica JP610]
MSAPKDQPEAQASSPNPTSGSPTPAASVPGAQLASDQSAAANSTNTSLYVGDLHPDVTEAHLFEVFNAVGPVASIRVCRDTITRRSLGYAYINFHNAVDADRALDTMNYVPIKNRPCRIMWSQRDPAMRKSGAGNIFIKNLEKTIDNKALYDTFSAFGNILSCKVVEDEQNNSRGFGFVHFETEEAAQLAIEKVNGMMLLGKQVYVGIFKPKKERDGEKGDKQQTFNNVFVKNLADDAGDDELKAEFEKYGPITSCVIARDDEGKSKGFGFICFEEPEHAGKAVEEMNETEFKGKPLFVARHQKKNERENELRAKFDNLKLERANKYQGVNLYIKNLDDDIDEDRLRQEFAPFGTITSHRISRDAQKNQSRGFGFVCFSSPEEATKAVTEMNGKLLGNKPLYVALAQRKDERQSQLAMQYAQRAPSMRMPGQMGTGPLYASGAPLFYTGPGMQGRPGMVYPPQMNVRPRWVPPQAGGARPGFSGMQGYLPGGGVQGMQHAQNPQQRGVGPRGQRPVVNRPGQQGGQPNKQRGGFNYSPSVRNVPGVGGPMNQSAVGVMPAAVPPVIPGQEPLTSSMLAQASPEDQTQMLGERLYPMIASQHPEQAGKITGMLLEMDKSELLHLLESREALNQKVDEAVAVLQAHVTSTQTPEL